MKTIYLILFGIISICLFNTCDKQSYFYIDKTNWFSFNENDTLTFNGTNRNDTFVVSKIYKRFRWVDKRSNFEQLEINIIELTTNCKNTFYDYCYGMGILREYNRSLIQWRNINCNISEVSNIVTGSYTIGSINIANVYTFQFNELKKTPEKDIKTVYYTHLYGIIAYETMNGDKYELDIKYLKH